MSSVADQGWLSRILIFTHSGSRIQKQQQKRGEKFFVKPLFVATNFTKLKIILFFNAEEKYLGQFSKNYRTFTQKFVTSSKKYGVGIRDPRSGIGDPEKNLFRIPDLGPGSKRHRIPDPQHCI
jgi:hypothetical protein